jgi:hypothetical protein
MNRKLIESYARKVLKTAQHVNNFYQVGNSIIIEFSYDEKYQQQDDTLVSLFDLISFTFSSCPKKQAQLKK